MSTIFRRSVQGAVGVAAMSLPSFGHAEAVGQRNQLAQRIEHFDNPYAQGVRLANSLLTRAQVPLANTAADHMFEAIQAVEDRRISSTTAATFHETAGFARSFVESARQRNISGMSSSMLGVIAAPLRGMAVNLAASQTAGSLENDARERFGIDGF
ncbi:hypothetical protein [Burkholderia glumae]|uniref:hypothetical protein n=1 Tax=Burkholderia glumae TaxID=337 RepID=UPI0020B32CAC|nr:hypothetical protein [Burkholderia glumae]